MVGAARRSADRQLSLFYESNLWKQIEEAQVVYTEVDCSYVEDVGDIPRLITGKIDLVFLKEGKWTIVDYKTDRMDATGLEEKYADQVATYVSAWKNVTQSDRVDGGIWWAPEGRWISLSG